MWLVRFVRRLARRTRNDWDDALVRHEVFLRAAHVVPALVAYYGVRVTTLSDTVGLLVQRVAVAFLIAVVAIAFSAFLNAVNDIYSRLPDVGHRPIKGYLGFVPGFDAFDDLLSKGGRNDIRFVIDERQNRSSRSHDLAGPERDIVGVPGGRRSNRGVLEIEPRRSKGAVELLDLRLVQFDFISSARPPLEQRFGLT